MDSKLRAAYMDLVDHVRVPDVAVITRPRPKSGVAVLMFAATLGASVLVAGGWLLLDSSSSLTPITARAPSGSPVGGKNASEVRAYKTIAQLTFDSTVVVAATAVSNLEATRTGTLQTQDIAMRVDEVWKGLNVPRSLIVRQLAQDGAGESNVVGYSEGNSYILFLQPGELVHGRPIEGVFVTVGGATGTYLRSGDEARDLGDVPVGMSPLKVTTLEHEVRSAS